MAKGEKNNDKIIFDQNDDDIFLLSDIESGNVEEYIKKKKLGYLSDDSYEHYLLVKFLNGNMNAFDTLFLIYKPMIIRIINDRFRYLLKRYDREDLTQVGSIGLLKALKSYNSNKKTKLSSHIFNCIRFELMNVYRNWEIINYPRSKKRLCIKYYQKKEMYEKKHYNEYTFEMGANDLQVCKEDLEAYVCEYDKINQTLSLENLFKLNTNYYCIEDSTVWRVDLKEKLSNLTEEEQNFVKLKFINQNSKKETMDIMCINEGEYKRLYKKTKNKLMYLYKDERLPNKRL